MEDKRGVGMINGPPKFADLRRLAGIRLLWLFLTMGAVGTEECVNLRKTSCYGYMRK